MWMYVLQWHTYKMDKDNRYALFSLCIQGHHIELLSNMIRIEI